MMNKTFLWNILSILVLMGLVIIGFSIYQNQKKQEMIRIATSKEARKVYEEDQQHAQQRPPDQAQRLIGDQFSQDHAVCSLLEVVGLMCRRWGGSDYPAVSAVRRITKIGRAHV